MASITYFQVEPGDEVVVVTPKDIESSWGSIENVLRKGGDADEAPAIDFSTQTQNEVEENSEDSKEDIEKNKATEEDKKKEIEKKDESNQEIYDDWASDIEEITRTIDKESDSKRENKN